MVFSSVLLLVQSCFDPQSFQRSQNYRQVMFSVASKEFNMLDTRQLVAYGFGDINRFQRLTGDIVHPFDDDAPSIPVAFTTARWGSLASFGASRRNGSKKFYGTSGNSFVAVVEFGQRVRAKAITAGGQSGDPASPHFNDQAERYSRGDLRDVYFYREQLEGHIEREYHPGG